MLETFTAGTFTPHVGTIFRIFLAEAPAVEIELTTVTPHQTPSGPEAQRQRAPFSLLFRGPLAPILPQRIYSLAHAELGTFDLFLVPIGPDAQGMRYEAVFG